MPSTGENRSHIKGMNKCSCHCYADFLPSEKKIKDTALPHLPPSLPRPLCLPSIVQCLWGGFSHNECTALNKQHLVPVYLVPDLLLIHLTWIFSFSALHADFIFLHSLGEHRERDACRFKVKVMLREGGTGNAQTNHPHIRNSVTCTKSKCKHTESSVVPLF